MAWTEGWRSGMSRTVEVELEYGPPAPVVYSDELGAWVCDDPSVEAHQLD